MVTRRMLRMRSLAVLVAVLVAVLLGGGTGVALADAPPEPGEGPERIEVLLLVVEGCPFCARMSAFLDDLAEFVGPAMTIERVDVEADEGGRERWHDEVRARGLEPTRVPVVVLGERIWVGTDDRIEQEIVGAVLARAAPQSPSTAPAPTPAPAPAPTPRVGEQPAQADAAGSASRGVALTIVAVLGLGAVGVGVRSRTRAGRPDTP